MASFLKQYWKGIMAFLATLCGGLAISSIGGLTLAEFWTVLGTTIVTTTGVVVGPANKKE